MDSFTLDFCIVDMGATIRKNVSEYLRREVSGKEAIEWAVEEGNTTRTGTIPGGLGLYLIREFLKLNTGKIQIVSADGFYEESSGEKSSRFLSHSFDGTAVNFQIDVTDQKYYCLKDEIKPEDIF